MKEKITPGKQDIAENGIKYFNNGYNCAQSVLFALYDQICPQSNDLIPKIAAGFGGGIGRCGSVCGALTGSIMAVGVKYGSNEANREKLGKVYTYASKLYKEFENQQGTTVCKDLIKYNLSNSEEAAKAREEKVFDKVCANLIRTAIKNFLEVEK